MTKLKKPIKVLIGTGLVLIPTTAFMRWLDISLVEVLRIFGLISLVIVLAIICGFGMNLILSDG